MRYRGRWGVSVGWDGGWGKGGRGDVLHAFGTAGPVAVVEFEFFALQDEGAEAVLWWGGGRGLVEGWRGGRWVGEGGLGGWKGLGGTYAAG